MVSHVPLAYRETHVGLLIVFYINVNVYVIQIVHSSSI